MNTDAWEAIVGNFNYYMNSCAGLANCGSIFGENTDCINSCFVDMGFTPGCAPAFGNMGECGYEKCKAPCISGDPYAPSCEACNE